MRKNKFIDCLPAGTGLLWYEIIKVLGKGGFGVTYLARDPNLDQLVAIKEYLPTGRATRAEGRTIQPNSTADAELFQWGLDRFLQEGRILAQFKHNAIVQVLSLFQDNNTAYIVMAYEEGESLENILKIKKTLSAREIFRFLPALLNGLAKLHQNNYIHRDIKPANILIRKNGTPVILDFGSTRQAVADKGGEMTSLLSKGYSPFEQYESNSDRQGPWSDIYALAGVLYRCISGEKPPDAALRISSIMRQEADPMAPALERGKGRFPRNFLRSVDKALMVMEKDRPQSIAEWRTMLFEGLARKKVPPGQPAAPPRSTGATGQARTNAGATGGRRRPTAGNHR